MKRQLLLCASLYSLLSCSSVSAETDFSSKLEGDYTSSQTDFVTMKRMIFSKEKDGKIKIQATLMGFPDEVSLGDATPEIYVQRKTGAEHRLLATFSSTRYKPFMVIEPMNERGFGGGSTAYTLVAYTCYFRDLDGRNVHISGTLQREESK